jgi:hypothetical protein
MTSGVLTMTDRSDRDGIDVGGVVVQHFVVAPRLSHSASGGRCRHGRPRLLLVWIVLYTQVSAPINRQLTAAADSDQELPNGRVLQAKWDPDRSRYRSGQRRGGDEARLAAGEIGRVLGQ